MWENLPFETSILWVFWEYDLVWGVLPRPWQHMKSLEIELLLNVLPNNLGQVTDLLITVTSISAEGNQRWLVYNSASLGIKGQAIQDVRELLWAQISVHERQEGQ